MMILGEVFMRHFLSIYRRGQMKAVRDRHVETDWMDRKIFQLEFWHNIHIYIYLDYSIMI